MDRIIKCNGCFSTDFGLEIKRVIEVIMLVDEEILNMGCGLDNSMVLMLNFLIWVFILCLWKNMFF